MLSDREDLKFLDTQKEYTKNWKIVWVPIDYRCLSKYREILQKVAIKNNIDFIVYSRNDQVADRKKIGVLTRYLQLGYTSISGIDQKDRIFQMKRCFKDFMECDVRITPNVDIKSVTYQEGQPASGTFSLIFDTEQVGCAQYALPRLLNLLRSYNVRATFFVCEILRRIYPNILEVLRQQNHEIGLHGRWHEYLSKYSMSDQEAAIGALIKDFGGQVSGANFIGRMNKDTILAMMNNNIKYFIDPFMNPYGRFGYPKIPNGPMTIFDDKKEISMIPLFFETYNLTWFSVKNWVDSAFPKNTLSNKHITILLHPFRDGNLQHIRDTDSLLNYLIRKNLRGVTLKEFLDEYQFNAKNNSNNRISIRDFNLFRRKKYCFPRTLRDVASIIPENSLMLKNAFRERGTKFTQHSNA